MRVLVTGAAGFAGRHLVQRCAAGGAEVVGLGRRSVAEAEPPPGLAEYLRVDLRDIGAVRGAVASIRPDRVFHLAADASVGASWSSPSNTIESNMASALGLLEAVRDVAPHASVLVACSAEEYGPTAAGSGPVTEAQPLRPVSPYAVSKASVDLLAGFYADAHGLRVVRTRAFNHTGPGQGPGYVVADLAGQIARAEAEADAQRSAVRLAVGDTSVRRDFTDVRDVVRAYDRLLECGAEGVFNVCRGESAAIDDIVAGLARQTPLHVEARTDPALVREHEVMEIRGSRERLTALTGWRPEIPLDDTLGAALDSWRERVRRAREP